MLPDVLLEFGYPISGKISGQNYTDIVKFQKMFKISEYFNIYSWTFQQFQSFWKIDFFFLNLEFLAFIYEVFNNF